VYLVWDGGMSIKFRMTVSAFRGGWQKVNQVEDVRDETKERMNE
jgi:hypothetical protein